MAADWVNVGQEVVLRSVGFGHGAWGRVTRIAKVYKTGNFVLDGIDGQWRALGDKAARTGEGYRYNRQICRPLTGEVKAEIARDRRLASARKVVAKEAARLEKLSRTWDDEVIAEAAAILARRQP